MIIQKTEQRNKILFPVKQKRIAEVGDFPSSLSVSMNEQNCIRFPSASHVAFGRFSYKCKLLGPGAFYVIPATCMVARQSAQYQGNCPNRIGIGNDANKIHLQRLCKRCIRILPVVQTSQNSNQLLQTNEIFSCKMFH